MWHRLVGGVVVIVAAFAAVPAWAVPKSWNDGTGGWSTGANWTPSGVPAAGDSASIVFSDDVARTVTYDYTGPAATLSSLTLDMLGAGTNLVTLDMPANALTTNGGQDIGSSGRALFTQSGGINTVNTLPLRIGVNGGSVGEYDLTNTGQLTATQQIVVGDAGTGTFLQSGGTATVNSLLIGASAGGIGTHTLQTGSLTVSSEVVGGAATGNGTLSGGTFQQSGGIHNVGSLTIGSFAGSTGAFTQNGGTLVSSSDENIGNSGTATFSQSGGVHTGIRINIGALAGSNGSYSLTGGTLNADDVFVGGRIAGAGGTGTLFVGSSAGLLNVANTITVYNTPGSLLSLQSGGTITTGGINVNGIPSLFSWSSGTLNITNDLALDSGLGPNTTSAALGSSLSLGSRILKVNGNETIGGNGTFSLTLGSTSGGIAAHSVTGDVTLKPGGSISSSNNGYMTYANFTQAGGTITGSSSFRNFSNFAYQSGSFTTTLVNDGTVTFGPSFSPTGLQNEASMTVSNGQVLAVGFNGLTNSGNFTVNAGTVTASTVTNTGTVTVTAGTFQTSGNSTLTNSGTFIVNSGTAGASTTTNNGTFVLNGGTISANTFTNSVSGSLTAHGTISSTLVNHGTFSVDGLLTLNGFGNNTMDGILQGIGSISTTQSTVLSNSAGGVINSTTPGGTLAITNFQTNNAGGTINIGPSSTLSLSGLSQSGWTNSGMVNLQGPGARLTGATITNNGGIIQGAGLITSSMSTSNSGLIRASGGELDFSAPSLTNSSQGQIQVLGGSTINFMQGIQTNSGTIALFGGTYDNSGRMMTNAGTINGYGTLRTGGLTNNSGKLLSIGEGNMDVVGTVTNNGVISIQNGRTAYFFNNVSGSGSFTGTGTAVFLASLSPGSSPALVTFAGGATLGGGTSLSMELGETTVGTGYDKIDVEGLLSIGGVLSVSLINNFHPHAGNSFDLLDWGTLSGTFSSLQLPALDPPLGWDTSHLYTSGVLNVISTGTPGDYNINGGVDAADYVMWRKGGPLVNEVDAPGTVNDADYVAWRERFGNGSSGSSGGLDGAAAVPEPGTFAIAVAGLVLMTCLFDRRVKLSRGF